MEGTLLLLLCMSSFIVGFLSVAWYVSWQQASSLRKQWIARAPQWMHIGCAKVLVSNERVSPSNISSLTKVSEIDEELSKVLELALRDYFEKWYHHYISPDPVCVHHARDIITHIIAEISTQCQQVDYLSFFIETIMEDFMEHLKCYKTAHLKVLSNDGEGQEKLLSNAKIRKIEDAFFEELDDWKAVCCSQQAKLIYFQRVTELLLYLLLPQEDFSNPVLQVLLTDLGAWQVWGPLLHTLTKPDNFNHAVITMCKDGYLTPESFTAAIAEGSSELELRSLQFKIQGEIKKLQKTGVTDLDHEKLNGLEAINDNARQLILQISSLEIVKRLWVLGTSTHWTSSSYFIVLKNGKRHFIKIKHGEVRPHPDNTTSLLSFSVKVPSYIITHEGSTKHCEFVLDVCCRHSQASVNEQWTTHRRYRDFQDMDLTLRNQVDNFPASLSLPALPAFNKLDPQRLETRRQSLEKYISTITDDKFLKEHPNAISHIILFLTEGEFTRSSNELTRMVDTFFKPLSSIKRNASLIKFSGRRTSSISSTAPSQSPILSSISSSPHSSPNVGRKPPEAKVVSGEEDEDSLPVDIMLVLLEELFDFSDKKWLRRQLPSILKQLAGGKISRKVVQITDWLTSSQQVASYIRDLAATMWPGGIPKQPHPLPSADVKAVRSLLARAKLIGSIPDDLKMLIGTESTVKGMARLFGLFQSEALNCCLALRLLEGLLDALYPSRNIRDTLRKLRNQISTKQY